ncbi:MAG: hypothetical protein J7J22_05485 [Candidatus Verstraetearchaeota archaeon]|nr:hypothetical protein [Candidatus Verstraetearchaeota archaeon]
MRAFRKNLPALVDAAKINLLRIPFITAHIDEIIRASLHILLEERRMLE